VPFIYRQKPDGKVEFVGGFYQFRIMTEDEHKFTAPECAK
jgi:hypothetical protein